MKDISVYIQLCAELQKLIVVFYLILGVGSNSSMETGHSVRIRGS